MYSVKFAHYTLHLPSLGRPRPLVLPSSQSSGSRRWPVNYPRSSRVRLWSLTRVPPRERGSGKFLKRRAGAAAGSVARCPATGRQRTSAAAQPALRTARPRPPDPPGGLCAGLCRADRFSAAAFSRTVAMTELSVTPPSTRLLRPLAPRTARPRASLRFTGPGGGAPGGLRPSVTCSTGRLPGRRLCAAKRPRPLTTGGAQVRSTWPGAASPALVRTSPRLDPLGPSCPSGVCPRPGASLTAPSLSALTCEH